MQWLFLFLICFYTIQTVADDSKSALLATWEEYQAASDDLVEFKKLSDKRYRVKFNALPYEGEMQVLAYDVEEIDYDTSGSPYSKIGYVEVDLVDTSAEQLNKYSRSYSRWVQSNTLFYNQSNHAWDPLPVYRKQLELQAEEAIPNGFWGWMIDYSSYLLLAVLCYFLYAMVVNDRRVKKSVALQQQAMREVEVTRRYMEESSGLHKQTNRLLEQILEALKRE